MHLTMTMIFEASQEAENPEARVFSNIVCDLISEHGYKEQRDGHDYFSTGCTTCANIYQALNSELLLDVLDADDEPDYKNTSEDELRDLLHRLGYTGVDELSADDLQDEVQAYYLSQRRAGAYNWS